MPGAIRRWGSACSTTSRSPGARDPRARGTAGVHPGLGCPSRQRDRGHLPAPPGRAVRGSTSGCLPRHRRAVGRGPGEGLGYTINAPVPSRRRRGDLALGARARHHPGRLEFRPQLILISAGFDGHGADPLASCALRDRLLRPDDRARDGTRRARRRAGRRRARGRLRPGRARRQGPGVSARLAGGRERNRSPHTARHLPSRGAGRAPTGACSRLPSALDRGSRRSSPAAEHRGSN